MAARNTSDSKRFVFRPPDKDPEAYFIPITRSGSIISQQLTTPPVNVPPKIIRSADEITPRTEETTPARRIVVIRNTKHPQVNQEPVDLGDFGKTNSFEVPPVINDGNKSVFLIRRHIGPTESSNPADFHQSVQEPPPTTSLEHRRTSTAPAPLENITSTDPFLSSSSRRSPPIRPKSAKRPTSSTRPENTQRYAPYLRRPRSKTRTPSPARRSPSPNRTRPKSSKHHSASSSPPPPKQEEPKELGRKRSFFSFFSKKSTSEVASSTPPVIIENELQTVQNRSISTTKSAQRKKSAKPVVLVHPDDQAVVVVENSFIKGEPLRPALKRSKSFKKTRFQDDIHDKSSDKLMNTSRWHTCLGCLSRYMCLVIIICLFFIIIGLAGVGVSAYFLATNSSTNLVPKIVGIAIGGVLAIAAFCFLYILLACIGARDGYFTYNDNGPHTGGRAFALIPPSHPNAHLYIPHEYMKVVENSHSTPSASASNGGYNQSSLMQSVSNTPYTQQQTIYRSNTLTNAYENKSIKNNITIEMPERLLTGRKMSPNTRERSLNKVVKNIGYIVEDAKKRYNGDLPDKVIVKVDKSAMQTA